MRSSVNKALRKHVYELDCSIWNYYNLFVLLLHASEGIDYMPQFQYESYFTETY